LQRARKRAGGEGRAGAQRQGQTVGGAQGAAAGGMVLQCVRRRGAVGGVWEGACVQR